MGNRVAVPDWNSSTAAKQSKYVVGNTSGSTQNIPDPTTAAPYLKSMAIIPSDPWTVIELVNSSFNTGSTLTGGRLRLTFIAVADDQAVVLGNECRVRYAANIFDYVIDTPIGSSSLSPTAQPLSNATPPVSVGSGGEYDFHTSVFSDPLTLTRDEVITVGFSFEASNGGSPVILGTTSQWSIKWRLEYVPVVA